MKPTQYALSPLLFIALFALLGSCTSETTELVRKTPAYSLEIARLISQASGGVVSSTEPLRVRFAKPMISPHLLGRSLRKEVFSFQPPLTGTTTWEDRRTLLFVPSQPLALRQSYQGSLDLQSLLPDPGQTTSAEFDFHFATAGREIAKIEAEFVDRKLENLAPLHFRAAIHFSEETTLDLVQEATALHLGTTPLELSWRRDSSGKIFTLTSETIHRRAKKEKRLVLDIAARGLELSGNYQRQFTLGPLQVMQLQEVEIHEGEHPRLTIHFSDELDKRQDIRGLLEIEPAVAIQTKSMGKTILVEGAFAPGRSYVLQVHAGIRGKGGKRTQEATSRPLTFNDLKPQIRFVSDGIFLPQARQRKIRFSTLNLARVHLEIKKVFESNLGMFLHTESLHSARDRRKRFNDYYLNRIGVQVASDTLEIGAQRNLWLEHELDLSHLLQADEKGLFLLLLHFGQEDMLYGTQEGAEAARQQLRLRYDHQAYRADPYLPGYTRAHGRVYKPLILSSIGLTYKKAHQRHLVYATHIDNARPQKGVEITLLSYQNQIIAHKLTDGEGRADFPDIAAEVFYVQADYQGQRSLIKPNEMGWNLSTFDVGGTAPIPEGSRAFIYTERGVYRPGDLVHLALIARHQDHTFPDDLPVILQVFNPRDQLVVEQTRRRATDGFYAFTFATRPQDPTGNWRAELMVGSRRFSHAIKVETIVPFKLKTAITPGKERLQRGDKNLQLELQSNYLFGSPAAGLKAELSLRLEHVLKSFAGFPQFHFTNERIDFQGVQVTLFKGSLDEQGRAQADWPLPALEKTPSALRAVLQSRVFERGGRPNTHRRVLPIEPYDYYVGIKKPAFDYGYAPVGTELKFSAVLVDTRGRPTPDRTLHYRIYKSDAQWWWEYDKREIFRRRFKSDRHTEQVAEGRLLSATRPIDLEFTPATQGEYLLEISAGEGHTAAVFLRAYPWGSVPSGEGGEATLALKTDKEKYAPGETALIRFPAPAEGQVLVALERGAEILDSHWQPLPGQARQMQLEIPITAAMMPTTYVTISLIQPYDQSTNDRPIRLYGVVPLSIKDPATVRELHLETPEVLRPNAPFQVRLQTSDGRPTQFTLAVVDEGLLALTDFETPDPWLGFFRKLRLGVRNFDLFAHVIGAVQGDVFKTFSIGGDMQLQSRHMLGAVSGSPLDPSQRRRFEPVSLFKGPLQTTAAGSATVQFDMPHYVGAVRLMAVAAQGSRYGHAARTLPVQEDLLLVSSLPRFLMPGDRFQLPVTLFALYKNPGSATVSIHLDGPLSLLGPARQDVDFAGRNSLDLHFEVQVDQAIGTAQVQLQARAGDKSAGQKTSIQVRPGSPRLYSTQKRDIERGERLSLAVPGDGIKGTNKARISVRSQPHLNFDSRLQGLVHYPYGCIEQTVSAAFPQLYLKDLVELPAAERRRLAAAMDAHINSAIDNLRRFQLGDGSFAFWPGSSQPSTWGGLYAGHFLLEARDLGFHVPADLLERWTNHQRSQALITRDPLLVRIYRAYLLALGGQPPIGALNLLRENSLDEMNDAQKWLLAAAYQLAGATATSRRIADQAGTRVEDYAEFAGTYGSGLRDQALILSAQLLLERQAGADSLARELAQVLAAPGWHSTQTVATVLVALGKYLKTLDAQDTALRGHIRLPDGQQVDFDTRAKGYQLEIAHGFGDSVEVYLDSSSALERAFIALDWEGVPLRARVEDQANNLELKVEWLSEDGLALDPAQLTQGTSFWGHFQVRNPTYAGRIEELALTQLLPSGWEIENARLSGAAKPAWMQRWQLQREDYVDIRDEGIVWFFDLQGPKQQLDFALKINAVSRGRFTLPPTRVEAMYKRKFHALKAGGSATVTAAAIPAPE